MRQRLGRSVGRQESNGRGLADPGSDSGVPALTLLILALFVAAPTPAAADPGCEAWSFDGYTLGMAKNEALAVRKAKLVYSQAYKVKEKGAAKGNLVFEFKGQLRFDEDRLWLWRRERALTRRDDIEANELFNRMTERLGEPTFMRIQKPNHWFSAYMPLDREFAWRSPDCDAVVILTKEYMSALDSLRLHLHLIRPSMLESYPRDYDDGNMEEVVDNLIRNVPKNVAGCTVEQVVKMKEMGLSDDQIGAACANFN